MKVKHLYEDTEKRFSSLAHTNTQTHSIKMKNMETQICNKLKELQIWNVNVKKNKKYLHFMGVILHLLHACVHSSSAGVSH